MELIKKITDDSNQKTRRMIMFSDRKDINYNNEKDEQKRAEIFREAFFSDIKSAKSLSILTLYQKLYENKKLSSLRIQHSSDVSSFPLVDGLSLDSLEHEMTKNFYSYSTMEAIRSAINVIVDTKYKNDKETLREKIHNFFRESFKFGADSVNGVAMKTSIYTKTNVHFAKFSPLVLKVPKNPDGSSEMIHELMIGLLGLNKLRAKCPNFSYVFDSFSCGEPIIGEDNKIIEIGLKGAQNVSYAIYENVRNASSFKDISNEKDFISLYLQILYALKIAHEDCDFTHYDLHYNNVLVTPFSDKDFYIPFILNDETIYLKSTGKIAMMIDYGQAIISVPENDSENVHNLKHVGLLNLGPNKKHFISVNMYPYKSNHMNDPYKLICFMLLKSFDDKTNLDTNPLYVLFKKICGYFYKVNSLTDEMVNFIIDSQWNNRFNLNPEVITENGWNIDDLITHCLKIAETITPDILIKGVENKPSNILGTGNFEEGYKYEIEQKQNVISTNEYGVISAIELYENKKEENEAFNKMLPIFLSSPEKTLEKEKTETQHLLDFTEPDLYYSVRVDAKNIYMYLNDYTTFVEKMIQLVQNITELTEKYKFSYFCKQLLDGDKRKTIFDDFVNEIAQNINMKTKYINSVKQDIMFDRNYLMKLMDNRFIHLENAYINLINLIAELN